jgi:hypothetical protein
MMVATRMKIIGTQTAKTASSVRVRRMGGLVDDSQVDGKPAGGRMSAGLEFHLSQPFGEGARGG